MSVKFLKLSFSFIFLILINENCKGLSSSNSNCSKADYDEKEKKSNFYNSQRPVAREMVTKLEEKFNKSKATVVLLANVAIDVSNEEFENPPQFYNNNSHKYMHTGIAYKNPDTNSWMVVHLINKYDDCGRATNQTSISNTELLGFYHRDHFKMDVLIKIPSEKIQEDLLKVLLDKDLLQRLHNKNYNAISNPYSTKEQNSNLFITYLIASSQLKKQNCIRALNTKLATLERKPGYEKDQYKAQVCAFELGFKHSTINPEIYKSIVLAFNPSIKPQVNTRNHSYKSQQSDIYPFVSAANVFDFLSKIDANNPRSFETEVCPRSQCNTARHFYLSEALNNGSNPEPIQTTGVQ